MPWNKLADSDGAYRSQAATGIADAVTQAWNSLHAAEVGIGSGREDSVAFCRRFHMRDGRTITHPGKPGTRYHGDIVAAEGPIDPEVGVLAVRRPGGKVTGIIVNYGCHNTVVGGEHVSPDYAGYVRKHLQAYYGDGTAVVFLLGACGDVTQVDNHSAGRETGLEYADMMGRKLAAEAVRVVNRVNWLKEAPLAAGSSTIALAFRPNPDEERERPAYGLGSAKDWEPVYQRDRQWLSAAREKSPTFSAEVQAVRIGPLAIVANGAEFFARDGLRVKAASPVAQTWVATLSNDCLGYVPPADAFVAGGYEPRTGCHSFLATDSAQRLIEAMLAALHRVKS